MKTCETCGTQVPTDPYREAPIVSLPLKPEPIVETQAKAQPSEPWLPSEFKEPFINIFVGLYSVLKFVVSAGIIGGLMTWAPYRVGTWAVVHISGKIRFDDWENNPYAIANWLFGVLIMYGWLVLMLIGQIAREDKRSS